MKKIAFILSTFLAVSSAQAFETSIESPAVFQVDNRCQIVSSARDVACALVVWPELYMVKGRISTDALPLLLVLPPSQDRHKKGYMTLGTGWYHPDNPLVKASININEKEIEIPCEGGSCRFEFDQKFVQELVQGGILKIKITLKDERVMTIDGILRGSNFEFSQAELGFGALYK